MNNKISIKTTRRKQVKDITDIIHRFVTKAKITDGLCNIFITHTTASLTTAVLDPGTDLDMLNAFELMVPKLKYRHPHNPAHVPDHIMSSIIGPSISIPIEDGELVLGSWQRIVLVELDGPRERNIIITIIKI